MYLQFVIYGQIPPLGNAVPAVTSVSMPQWIGDSTNAHLGSTQFFSVKSNPLVKLNPQIIDRRARVSRAESNRISRRGLMAEIMQEFTDNNDDLLLQLAR